MSLVCVMPSALRAPPANGRPSDIVVPNSEIDYHGFWSHLDPMRLGVPRYQNMFGIVVWFLFLLAYSQAGKSGPQHCRYGGSEISLQSANPWISWIPITVTWMPGRLSCMSWLYRSPSKVSAFGYTLMSSLQLTGDLTNRYPHGISCSPLITYGSLSRCRNFRSTNSSLWCHGVRWDSGTLCHSRWTLC